MSNDESIQTASRGAPTTSPDAGAAISIAELAASYLEDVSARQRLAGRTLDLRRQQLRDHVIPSLGPGTLASSISVREIRQMIGNLERRGLGGSTIRSCAGAASALFRHGIRDLGILCANPVRELERGDLPSGARRSEPRYLDIDEVERLCALLSDSFRPVAWTCFWAGARISEALALRWGDIDFVNKRLRVRGTKSTSSNAWVPLVSRLERELQLHLRRTELAGPVRRDALIFRTRNGLSPGRRNAHRAISRAAVKAGLVPEGAEPVGVHDLRHSLASAALASGCTLAETARLLRHSHPGITARVYAGLAGDSLTRIGAKLETIGTEVRNE
jgi:integrase